MKRRINELIREGLLNQSGDEEIAFFCECADEQCHQIVWLTGPHYDRARRNPNWVALLPDHAAGPADDGNAEVPSRRRADVEQSHAAPV